MGLFQWFVEKNQEFLGSNISFFNFLEIQKTKSSSEPIFQSTQFIYLNLVLFSIFLESQLLYNYLTDNVTNSSFVHISVVCVSIWTFFTVFVTQNLKRKLFLMVRGARLRNVVLLNLFVTYFIRKYKSYKLNCFVVLYSTMYYIKFPDGQLIILFIRYGGSTGEIIELINKFWIRFTFWFKAGSRIIENKFRGYFSYPNSFPNTAGQS